MAGDRNETKQNLKRRLQHLWGLALQCSKENPELSRYYVNEILSADNGLNGVAQDFCMKYCEHCGIIFKGDNCRVRMQPKRGKKKNKNKKKKEENTSKYLNKKQVLNLPRNRSHVGVFCKECGRQSFYPSKARDKRTRPKRSTPAAKCKQNDSTTQDTTPVLSKSARARRRSRTSKLKDILQADERQKSASTGSSPQLQDFLSSLGHAADMRQTHGMRTCGRHMWQTQVDT